jgi:hypothetical protein
MASEMRLAPLLPLSVLLLRARIGHSKHLSTETVQSCLTRRYLAAKLQDQMFIYGLTARRR